MKGWQWLIFIGIVVAAIGGGVAAVDITTGQTSDLTTVVEALAQAIATAEGFFVSGSLSQRSNNPGDLTDANGSIEVFPTASDGWNALRRQVESMFDGSSRFYNPSMSLADIGQIYAGGDPAWSSNVAAALGVSVDTTLNQLVSRTA